MKPEEKARQVIDKRLEEAGWVVQNFEELNLGASSYACSRPIIHV